MKTTNTEKITRRGKPKLIIIIITIMKKQERCSHNFAFIACHITLCAIIISNKKKKFLRVCMCVSVCCTVKTHLLPTNKIQTTTSTSLSTSTEIAEEAAEAFAKDWCSRSKAKIDNKFVHSLKCIANDINHGA